MGTKVITNSGRITATFALLTAIACTPIIRSHGYVPSAEELSMITIGKDTRDTVTRIAGPPTSGGLVDNSAFYYVSSTFRHFGAKEPLETDREVLAISFDSNGLVSNIERYGLQDGAVIVLSRRVTASSVSESTFIRQLLGSIGRVNAGDFLGES